MRPTTERRLYRSRNHRWIAGVAGGLGEYFRVDPNFVRIGMVIAAIVAFPVSTLVVGVAYLAAAFFLPEEPSPLPD